MDSKQDLIRQIKERIEYIKALNGEIAKALCHIQSAFDEIQRIEGEARLPSKHHLASDPDFWEV